MGDLRSNIVVLTWRRRAGSFQGATEGPQMPAIVEYPHVVREAMDELAICFRTSPNGDTLPSISRG